jgi:hypothetical protein
MQRMIFMALVTLLISGPAWSEDYIQDLKGIKTVNIKISDQVSDRCWSNPSSAKTFVEKELLSSGIGVTDKIGDVTFQVMVIGYARENKSGNKLGCVASLIIQASYIAMNKPPYSDKNALITGLVFIEAAVLSNKSDLTNQINQVSREIAAEFAVNVMKANMGT